MMSNNKILTVSYGTFSCTLEGFDDSFGTMKAIAEYFRDLAADDRYFGAEPPQPDADMLARIAQKEVSRRVQAHERDGQIVLSAVEEQSNSTAPAAALAAAAPVAAAAAEQAAPEAPAPQPTPEIEPEAPAAEATPQAPAPQSPAETAEDEATPDEAPEEVVAAEPVAPTPLAEEPEVAETVAADEAVADDIEEDEYTDDTPLTAEITPEDDDENDIVPGQPDAEVEAFFAETPLEDRPDDMFEDDDIEGDTSPAAPLVLVASNDTAEAPKKADHAGESIADKLERIRAVVARQNDDADTEDFLEDEHADIGAAAPEDADDASEETNDDLVAQARADIEGALDADDAADAGNDDAQTEDDELSAMLSRLDDAQPQAAQDETETAAPDTDDALDSALENMFEDDADKSEDDTAEEGAAPRARVIKVKRADLEAAIEKGDLEEYEDDAMPALDDVAPAKTTDSSLSPEEEADLVRELAALEADTAAEDMPDAQELVAEDVDSALDDAATAEVQELDGDAEEVAQDDAKAAGSKVLPSLDGDESGDVNRLLAETASQMDEPESATRRDAFAHLRAAVAARKADGTMDADDAAAKDANAYRSDLADVVRPRRPEAPVEGKRTERPEDAGAAPLKLVAEQRIDLGNPHTKGPVSPRRVSGVADSTPADASENESFAAYASEMGVDKLPELLEAAASYMSFVEGREEFSRPQLMTKVRQAGPAGDFSREDGLRSFGQLLRSGKISKIKGGRFTVSDDIGYRPSEREAG